MKEISRIPEDIIYKIWEEKRIEPELETQDGLKIDIIEPGVRIGNITFTGDVEIDNYHSDWRAHGHHLNQRYNKTILHIVLSNDSSFPFVLTQNGRKIPTIEIANFLTDPIKDTLISGLKSKKNNGGFNFPCRDVNSNMERHEKLRYIKNLGLLRFKKKCEKYVDRIKELIILDQLEVKEPKINHDFRKEIESREFSTKEFENPVIWNQLFYEQVFEALGYSKNKDIMNKLSRAIEIRFLIKLSNLTKTKLESILFHVSGILPEVTEIPDEETSSYIRELLENWLEVKNHYDSEMFKKEQWHFFKIRPQNFPTIRLAAGAIFLDKLLNHNLFFNLVDFVKHSNDEKQLVKKIRNELILKADGYWKIHYNFNKVTKAPLNYFIGIGRADEIIVNIILPVLSVYFEILNKQNLSKKVLEVYLNYYQKEGNHLVDEINSALGFKNEKFRSVYYQGMIDLFRNYCIKQKCLECKIGKEVFS